MDHSRPEAPAEVADLVSPSLGSMALVLAGVLFVLYPAIRPFSSEKGLAGARAFASNAWLVAHCLAIVGFLLLGFGLLGNAVRLRRSPAARLANRAFVASAAGIGLTLPFYGAEVFGLHALGREALARNDPTLLAVSDKVRFGVGIAFISVGLVLLAVGTVMLAVAVWRSGVLPRGSGVLLATAFVLYLPQFTAGQAVRVAHGCLVLAGCVSLAWGLWAAAESDTAIELRGPEDRRARQSRGALSR
jgi:hypothetical protein